MFLAWYCFRLTSCTCEKKKMCNLCFTNWFYIVFLILNSLITRQVTNNDWLDMTLISLKINWRQGATYGFSNWVFSVVNHAVKLWLNQCWRWLIVSVSSANLFSSNRKSLQICKLSFYPIITSPFHAISLLRSSV